MNFAAWFKSTSSFLNIYFWTVKDYNHQCLMPTLKRLLVLKIVHTYCIQFRSFLQIEQHVVWFFMTLKSPSSALGVEEILSYVRCQCNEVTLSCFTDVGSSIPLLPWRPKTIIGSDASKFWIRLIFSPVGVVHDCFVQPQPCPWKTNKISVC